MTKKLIVTVDNKLIGEILESNDNFTFSYDQKWISTKNSFDISPKIKRSAVTHSGVGVRNFLENLLPEEQARKQISEAYKVDVKDVAGLLEISGKDSAGALQIYSEKDFSNLKYNPQATYDMSISELSKGIGQNGTAINFIKKIGLKPSLSGAQDKITCRYDEVKQVVSFPTEGGATTHIIKPSAIVAEKTHRVLEMSALNELVAMKIARNIFKETPVTNFFESDHRDLFIIDRYDRKIDSDGNIERIHQFDFCQYFGIPSSDKYEVRGGKAQGKYGLVDILNAIQKDSDNALMDQDRFMNWIVFNYLMENTDGHLKNLSLIADGNGLKLAPFYDITSVGFYKHNSHPIFDNEYAFSIGGRSNMSSISSENWILQSRLMDKNDRYLLEKLKKNSIDISRSLEKVYAELSIVVTNRENKKVLDKIMNFIGKSIEKKGLINLKGQVSNHDHCLICGRPLSNEVSRIFGIGSDCLKKFK